jgi:alpha-L-rhamnosidase
MRQVLWFFSNYQQADGSLKNVPYWNFTDWAEAKGWSHGIPPIGKNGNSAILDLQLLLAYQAAAELEKTMGIKEYAAIYEREAVKLKNTIRKKYWNAGSKLFADTPEKDIFSQHANALAILGQLVTGSEALQLAHKILSNKTLTEATIYFKYYVHQALTKAGLGDAYLQWLDIWYQNLKNGLTTWAEISDINDARSDCHAWGSSPNIEFFRILLGIDSDAPGFKKVKIEPHLGTLKKAYGKIPHPEGEIETDYKYENGKWKINIIIPGNVPGRFVWKGKSYPLKPGKNTLSL